MALVRGSAMADAKFIAMMRSLIVENPTDVDRDDDKHTSPISFLKFPPEIRNKIYRYSLIEPTSANPIFGLAQPPLTRTSRLIRSEALPIYYGNNQFLLDLDDSDRWPDVIRMFREFKAGRTGGRGTGSLQHIRHLACRMRSGSTERPLSLRVALIDSAYPRGFRRIFRQGWGSHTRYRPEDARVLQDWDLVHKLVEKCLSGEKDLYESDMHRLISITVMVANECPSVTKEIHFHSRRRPVKQFPLWSIYPRLSHPNNLQ